MGNTVDLGLTAGSACLMDAATGEILYEHNSREKLEPASVTKVMTLLLAMEALDNGTITLETKICASKKASEMGGSQIWLEYGEELTFDEMLKAIVVVSANDCTVALAEHLAGSEEAFCVMMNNRAKELGMEDTNFLNSTGLPVEGHVTSARDIAIMTRELSKHKTIFNYTTIWMDSLRNGEMGLSNTNKLIRFYKGATGMKTGFTSTALYCLSATASRDNLDLIASVMKCQTSDDRFENAKKLLDYGFANFASFTSEVHDIPNIPVKGGVEDSVPVKYSSSSALLTKNKIGKVEEKINLPEYLEAPIKKDDKIGEIIYSVGGEIIAKSDILAQKDVKKSGYTDIISKIFKKLIMLK
ncbi:MAG: D-alanyl-D-alanine carboxypeptidase [Clostridia bacterium]|nr:D-alanyl-D-alanine carboxypeptidase [Clostridia bacterium]